MSKTSLAAHLTLLVVMVIVVSWLLAVKPCPTLSLQGPTILMDINQPSSVTTSPSIIPGLHRIATIKLLSAVGAPSPS